jgi:hypothetical protein
MSRKIYQQFNSANVIGVTLEHNGFQGGNATHGGFVKLNIENLSSTNMSVNGIDCGSFEVTFRGDSERETLLSALKMVVKELEQNETI